jgi:hypothetical protein
MADPAQIDESIRSNNVQPVFSDGFLLGFRFKAKPKSGPLGIQLTSLNAKNASVVSGLIELTFVDESKQQALSRFIIDRETAENLSKGLIDTIKKFDEVMGKEGLSKIMPKAPEKKGDTSYR